jgi:luciferase-like monooxygenase
VLEERVRDVRSRIAFYASTRAHRAVFEHHGWGTLVEELHRCSAHKRWEEMPRRIGDDVLDTIAVIGTHDQIAGKLKQPYGGIATAVEFGIPLRGPGDREALMATIRDLHR